MTTPFRLLPALVATAWALPIGATATQCPQHYAHGTPPTITQAKMRPRTQEVCFEAFAVLHSGISRTPLYAAEYLTRANLAQAKTLSRKDSFHPEDALPPRDRAELSDYARSGYDRGHMPPNADMPTRNAQAQSFSLANMVPQVHENNAGVWAGMEAATRQLAMDEGELYVISGPAFLSKNLEQVGNVLVPTHLWKVLYSPRQQRAGAYVISNDKTRDYTAISLVELEKLVGVNPLPALPPSVQEAGMNMPKPQAQRGGKKAPGQPAEEEFTLREASRLLGGVVDGVLRFFSK